MLLNLRARLPALMLATLLLPACGIVFSAEFEGTEVFRDLELEGDFVAGSPISATVTLRQPYPVPLAVSCRFEDRDISHEQRRVAFAERALAVYETVLEPNADHHLGDEDREPVDMEHRFEFTVAEPGNYFIACFTFAAPENGIGERFTIEAR